ncbi:phosphatidic acid phosphatase type 2/haloperoxidase [Pseudoneurospora amorphoporcata]|uniref:Dolichyldiphosphatase n=1 Tax=Pseudoneurospora amorphoporcata TaxID=241081 RepID=A0AAN6SGU7_9PEZI|nr:phosphatidic acid phosphatase type 2/haloperoxidase [Pseudoneurospora amorphoporcata]
MADDVTPLASLSLTHVYYNPDDPISLLCAWLALVPQALCVVYATLIWSTREAEVILMFAGQLACEAANFALKRLIKEERPARIHATGGKGYGMPSSHAQFAFFWAVAVGLFLLGRHTPKEKQQQQKQREKKKEVTNGNGTTNSTPGNRNGNGGLFKTLTDSATDLERYAHEPWSFAHRFVASLGALVLAGAVAWSRIYLGYHTEKQVLVGCGAGTLCAVAWFVVTHVVRQSGLLGQILDFPVVRWFRIRDLVVEEDLPQAGWEKWEEQRVAKSEVEERKKGL